MSSWLETAPSFNPAEADSLLSYNLAQLGASGNVYFVSLTGNDGNDGLSWSSAFRTIIHAVSIAIPSDIIIVGAGIFDETANGPNGVVINIPFLNIYSSFNTTITNSDTSANGGSVITLGSSCAYSGVHGFSLLKGETTTDNAIVIKIDGASFSSIVDTTVGVEKANYTGIQFTNGAIGCSFGSPLRLSTRFIFGSPSGSIGVDFDNCVNCTVIGSVVIANFATGVNFSSSSSVCGTQRQVDISNCTIGTIVNPGAVGNITGASFTNCTFQFIDNSGNGTNEKPSVSLITPEAHEDMWPVHLGQGVAASPITITNTATDDTPDSRDDQDYWGDTVAIIAPGAITGRWISNGIEIFAGVANKIMRMEYYYPQPGFFTTRNGGNLWDLGETALTVTNGAIIQNGDKVWITSTSDPNGEILLVTNVAGNVITVASETRASGNTGIRYNHAGGETMYVVERSGLNRIDGHQSAYSASSTKASARQLWSVPKDLPPSTGMIGRLLNIDDNLAASIQVNVVYGD